MLNDFHFMRTWWLMAILPVALCWYVLRRHRDGMYAWKSVIAPHLLPHLLKTEGKSSSFHAIDLASLICCVASIAAAGPSWYRAPTPFADDTAALAIVVKVTPSMLTEDVQPARLSRSIEKIHDLLKQRGNAKTSLIAYSGTAHVVMPATNDGNIIDTFAQSLDPKIMPLEGDAALDALRAADQTLRDAGGGSIWWIADDIPQDQSQPLQKWLATSHALVHLYPVLTPGNDADKLDHIASEIGVHMVPLSADDADIRQLAKLSNFQPAISDDSQGRWVDSGYWLTPLLAIAVLPLFRRGTFIFGG